MFKRTISALAFLMASFSAFAGGGITGGATEPTQIANNLQLIMSYGQQAQQTATQMQQYATMLRNLQRITPSSLLNNAAQQLWKDQGMSSNFQALYQIVNSGQQIAYTARTIDAQMNQLNPGYGKYLSSQGFDLQNAYRNWSNSTQNAVNAALRLTTVHAEDMSSEADVMSELSNLSNTADGQVQAVQAGNQIGIAMVGQMQKMRQLQMAQMNAQNQMMNAQLGDKAMQDTVAPAVLKGRCSADKMKASPGFGTDSWDPDTACK